VWDKRNGVEEDRSWKGDRIGSSVLISYNSPLTSPTLSIAQSSHSS
jgi:hypothetical protein